MGTRVSPRAPASNQTLGFAKLCSDFNVDGWYIFAIRVFERLTFSTFVNIMNFENPNSKIYFADRYFTEIFKTQSN